MQNIEKLIAVYMKLTAGQTNIRKAGGRWIIETPEADIEHETVEALAEDLKMNLEAMREMVEPEIWREAWEA